jgi:hypothetical protein
MDADVEYLIETIEASFGVKFSESELHDDTRIDEVCCALTRRLGNETTNRCFSSMAFWRLRRALVETRGVPRNSVRPSTSLDYLIPEVHRRTVWRELGEKAGLQLPRLEYPRYRAAAIFLVSFVLSTMLAILVGDPWAPVAAVLGLPLVASLLIVASKPFANAFPAHSRTIGDAARTIGGLNYSKLAREFGPSRERERREALHYVIADVTGIEPSALITENPRLIDLVLANDGFRTQL